MTTPGTDTFRTEEIREYFRVLEGDGVYRPALRRFDNWLRADRERAWNEGFDEAMDDLGAGAESGMNPYGSDEYD